MEMELDDENINTVRLMHELSIVLDRHGLHQGEEASDVPHNRAANLLISEVHDWYRSGLVDPDADSFAEFVERIQDANFMVDELEEDDSLEAKLLRKFAKKTAKDTLQADVHHHQDSSGSQTSSQKEGLGWYCSNCGRDNWMMDDEILLEGEDNREFSCRYCDASFVVNFRTEIDGRRVEDGHPTIDMFTTG